MGFKSSLDNSKAPVVSILIHCLSYKTMSEKEGEGHTEVIFVFWSWRVDLGPKERKYSP